MYDDFTALIEYLSPVNSCEIADGQELVVISASCEGEALYALADGMARQGYSSEDYHVLDIVPGRFENIEDFWAAQNYIDDTFAIKRQQELEEQLWAQYADERYGSEFGC